MRDTLGAAPEAHFLTEVVPSFPANGTLPTGQTDLQRDSVPDPEAGDSRTNGYDDARGLVAQGEGAAGTEVAIGELFIVRDIGAADARGFDTDLKFAHAGLSKDSGFLSARGKSEICCSIYRKGRRMTASRVTKGPEADDSYSPIAGHAGHARQMH